MAQKEHEMKWLFDSDMRNSISVQLFDYKMAFQVCKKSFLLKKDALPLLAQELKPPMSPIATFLYRRRGLLVAVTLASSH